MEKTLRGRPRLNLKLENILEAVRRHRKVLSAARELGCSDAYVQVRLKDAGLGLRHVLEADCLEDLLQDQCKEPL